MGIVGNAQRTTEKHTAQQRSVAWATTTTTPRYPACPGTAYLYCATVAVVSAPRHVCTARLWRSAEERDAKPGVSKPGVSNSPLSITSITVFVFIASFITSFIFSTPLQFPENMHYSSVQKCKHRVCEHSHDTHSLLHGRVLSVLHRALSLNTPLTATRSCWPTDSTELDELHRCCPQG